MDKLAQQLIQLGHTNPELRDDIRPILATLDETAPARHKHAARLMQMEIVGESTILIDIQLKIDSSTYKDAVLAADVSHAHEKAVMLAERAFDEDGFKRTILRDKVFSLGSAQGGLHSFKDGVGLFRFRFNPLYGGDEGVLSQLYYWVERKGN
jgi:hypothetical protein